MISAAAAGVNSAGLVNVEPHHAVDKRSRPRL